MDYSRDQNDYPLPAGNNKQKRKSAEFLPKFFRTQANKKLLGSTLDQLLQPGVAEKLDGFYGRTTARSFKPGDTYIEDVSEQRRTRQLEPASVIKDDLGNLEFFKDYTDYINQSRAFGANVSNQSLFNSQEYYAWNPNIDWDKFVNFRQYFWLPFGPQTVRVFGQSREVQSTYTVTAEVQDDNTVYKFSPPGFTPNPTLKLYRGQRYRFEINCPGNPIAFATDRRFLPGDAIITTTQQLIQEAAVFGGLFDVQVYDAAQIVVQNTEVNFEDDENISSIYEQGIIKEDNEGNNLQTVYIEQGIVEFTIPLNAPDRLYYVNRNSQDTSGLITVYDIEENSAIDVENEIIGKKTYTSANGVDFTNGLKVSFGGNVTPAKYANDEWYVEGVGDQIVLVNEKDLVIPAAYAADELIPFGSGQFDRLPFGNATSYAKDKDYLVINRSSPDKNSWSRYNKWFHRDVILASARYNNQPVDLDQDFRATRPIIEFESGLKLYDFGTKAKQDVDLIDTFTIDAFSTVEGSLGYSIDNTALANGMRVIFTADTDPLVQNKIFVVNFELIQNQRQISLREAEDAEPLLNETILVKNGEKNRGRLFYFDGETWKAGQEKTSVNQAPLFDLFDSNGDSFSNSTVYRDTTFKGNRVFSYRVGTQEADDPELGFPLDYRSIENIGDIVFDFNLLNESFTYQEVTTLYNVKTDSAFLRRYSDRETFVSQNGWTKAVKPSEQYVIRQYIADQQKNNFAVDVFTRSGAINDLKVRVYVDNKLRIANRHYEIDRINDTAYIRFYQDLDQDSVVILKCSSASPKNENGYYEIAHNLERNPLNNNVVDFTFGEVNDHVESIVENLRNYDGGTFPGASNLRDLGNVDGYGKRFVQHSGPVNLALYSITDKASNIVKAIKYNRSEYAKFKRVFLQTAETLGFDGPVKQHVDKILQKMNSEKSEGQPFYFSDMAGTSGARRIEHKVTASSNRYFALTKVFNPKVIGSSSVLVYLNGIQLIHEKEYLFNNEGFVEIKVDIVKDDIVEIYEYDSTDGCFIPPTPTKLGLFPRFEPKKFLDDTTLIPRQVIQGHDGSIVFAFGDYRDDLILEIEKRIYNNLKQDYNPNVFDIHEFVSGEYRNTGFSKETIDRTMVSDFIEWLKIAGDPDYTSNSFYERTNGFSYNYSSMVSPNGRRLPGFWRAVYKQAYDTDRPHSHPWEMLGYSIKPEWWDQEYGPAPYTSSNLLLWRDIEEGIRREPGSVEKRNPKYARSGITQYLPVDDRGNLIDPLTSGYANNYIERLTRQPFRFGDETPTETAWRRSSEYPFSLITAWVLNQPAKAIGLGFDRSRIIRNEIGQIVYSETGKRLRLQDLVYPNTVVDNQRTTTSGLVNFVYNYMTSSVLLSYNTYKSQLSRITNQLALKVGGFTEKEKFNLILDSRTPLNEGNVFIPKENYEIYLNTSSPIDVVTYSGVIVEKISSGFVVRGYDRENPVFYYNEPIIATTDPVINVGGLSEEFVEWDERKQYIKGQNVRYNTRFYRVKESHISTTEFDSNKFQQLSSLPQVGGRDAVLRRNYTNKILEVSYGTVFDTIQDVVDFLLGYEAYLKTQGFKFEYFNKNIDQIENWTFSVKEFLFWTTQNWATGSVITLSPGATEINFEREYAVVDDIFDNFYDYTLLKADGKRLEREFSSIARDNENEFGLRSKNTADGIFHVKLPLVQKEHIVLLDNRTVFNDIIYDPEAGYRQERIRVNGYRSDEWNGSLDIPGFIYDEAVVVDWEAWKDYTVGTVVKYKEFYYVALSDLPGSEVFVPRNWQRLDERPTSKMIPNFDYRINQFADFYDLDSDNFDLEQQRHAQHLIGYQKRQYLQNIINDDVSQYKFYQGMIQDKGTRNVLDKLFNALSSANKDSLEFYEEWAIRVGRYGATDNVEMIEFILDESKFRLDPQPIELVNRTDPNSTDLVYRQRPFEVYSRPRDYDNNPFPKLDGTNQIVKDSGYVRSDDVTWTAIRTADILVIPIQQLPFGEYIWLIGDLEDWDVLQHIRTKYRITALETFTENNILKVRIIVDKNVDDLNEGDIVGVSDLLPSNTGFFEVDNVSGNIITAFPDVNKAVSEQQETNGFLSVLRSVRADNVKDANKTLESGTIEGQRFWIDTENKNDWYVLENQEVFTEHKTVLPIDDDNITDFSKKFTVSDDNTTVVVADNNKIYSYSRSSESTEFKFRDEIEIPDFLLNLNEEVSEMSIAISPDAKYLAVGFPNASSLATDFALNPDYSNFKDKYTYNPKRSYTPGDIVSYTGQYWQAIQEVLAETDQVLYSTFNSYAFLEEDPNTDSTDLTLLLQGAPYLQNSTTNHFLVRVPDDQYKGSLPGDSISLKWNKFTNLNRSFDNNGNLVSLKYQDVEPFNDKTVFVNNPELKFSEVITGEHEIKAKVDNILYMSEIQPPKKDEIVSTSTGEGRVYDYYRKDFNYVIYLTEVKGIFENQGELYDSSNTLIGTFSQPKMNDNPQLGGFWLIETQEEYINIDEFATVDQFGDSGYGLIYQDLIPSAQERSPFVYANILDNVNQVNDLTQEVGFLINLSYLGDNYEEDAATSLKEYKSNLWLVRSPKELETNDLEPGKSFRLWVNNSVVSEDIELYGFDYNEINNQEHTVYDQWDGYIDFDLTFNSTPNVDIDNDNVIGDIVQPPNPETDFDNIAKQLLWPNGEEVEVFDNITGATAQVAWYQRSNIFDGRIYIKSTAGIFGVGNDLRIRYRETPSGEYSNRTLGRIVKTSIANNNIGKLLVIENSNVFEPVNPDTYSRPLNDFALINNEYWIYNNDPEAIGAPIEPSYPSSISRDWIKVRNIPIRMSGSQIEVNQGVFSIFERNGQYWSYRSTYTVPNYLETTPPKNVGKKFRFAKKDDLYRLYVADENSIQLIKHGEDDNGNVFNWALDLDENYRGLWNNVNSYITGEVVEYYDIAEDKKSLYRSLTFNTVGDEPSLESNTWQIITDDIAVQNHVPYTTGNNVFGDITYNSLSETTDFTKDFAVTKDSQVLVTTSETTTEIELETSIDLSSFIDIGVMIDQEQTNAKGIVSSVNGNIISLTNVIGEFDFENELKVNGKVFEILTVDSDLGVTVDDVLIQKFDDSMSIEGVIKNINGLNYIVETSYNFISSNESQYLLNDQEISITNIERFIPTRVISSDSVDNRLVVYRQKGDRYQLSQIIDAPTSNTKWGESIDISPDGRFIVVGEPENDSIDVDQGVVYVYRQIGTEYQLDQTFTTFNNKAFEKFGFKVGATNNAVIVSSFNGDIVNPTTFDVHRELLLNQPTVNGKQTKYVLDSTSNENLTPTTFDSGFTTFSNTITDSGSVFLYEEIDNQFLYADSLEFADAKNMEFGTNIDIKDNHIYVALPKKGQGELLDYRRNKNQKTWTKLRESNPIVDTRKIKNAYLYNRKTNSLVTYLDVIDPVQGRIAGTADQELTFKMFIDPAKYNFTTENRSFDATNNWEQNHVGQLWWDLSTARFINAYQGDAPYQASVWNRLVQGSVLDVYEWVESDLLPSEWDTRADTPEGVKQGISGLSKYGNNRYSQKLVYDEVSQTFRNKYFFWVKNKFTLPSNTERKITAGSVARLINNPDQENYRYVVFYSTNRFAVYNCESLIKDTDVVLAVEYYTQDNQDQNVHAEYQIITEGLETSIPKPDIEQKWIDSLVGQDVQGRKIPDPDLSPRERYGTLFRPRQSWFVNRQEALKQVVERANISLQKKIIVDDFDLSKLLSEDPQPLEVSRLYDYKVSTEEELRFIGTNRARQAKINLEVENGSVKRATIIDAGRSYNDLTYNAETSERRVGPTVAISGKGTGIELDLTINNVGAVVGVDVVDPGQGYDSNTFVTVRKLSALVENDSTIGGRWAIYEWSEVNNEWNRTLTQDYDVKVYWDYIDWYAEGYNEFTPVDHLIDYSYELFGLDVEVGEIVKISSIGNGGWLLLKKVNDDLSRDYTVNYDTIGRQNGTIRLRDEIYNNIDNSVGFDNFVYDNNFFDTDPATETRIILQTLKDDIFVDDLAVDYNELFFASIRYVLSEQQNVDWLFKTSFVKAKHNVGELDQKVTFQNDNLPSYNAYIEEVKPYKTNIREYLSAYEKTDNTNSFTTDFDLAPVYSSREGKIVAKDIKVRNNELIGLDCLTLDCDTYPDRPWLENVGFKVVEIRVKESGSGYTTPPKVTLEGGGGTGATARAFLSAGRVNKIQVTNPGVGYLSAPRVIVEGSQTETGKPAVASAVIGDSVVRSTMIGVKFDRISGEYKITDLLRSQNFVGSGNITKYNLEWPMEIKLNRVEVTIDGEESLRSEYTFRNIKDTSKGYDRYYGQIEFTTPPALNSQIQVSYFVDPSVLDAQDRIFSFYKPTSGMLGNELSQLMSGIDYGGVEVRSFDFDGPVGWDTDEWYTDIWDSYDNIVQDQYFRPSSSTTVIELDQPLEEGVVYNIYKQTSKTYVANGNTAVYSYNDLLTDSIIVEITHTDNTFIKLKSTSYTVDRKNKTVTLHVTPAEGTIIDIKDSQPIRIDDAEYGTENETNPNAQMPSITGDGSQILINLDDYGITANDGDVFVIRKTTSDGSFEPDPDSYDTVLTGGRLDYGNASGLAAEDFIVDGDSFVTPTTSGGPEELVPGQILDTVDIKVFERVGSGVGEITNQNYIAADGQTEFQFMAQSDGYKEIIVKVNNDIISNNLYNVDYNNQKVIFETAPLVGDKVSIITFGLGGAEIIDINTIVSDGSSTVYETNLQWQENLNIFISIDGKIVDNLIAVIKKINNNIAIEFAPSPPETGTVVEYGIFVEDINSPIQTYSILSKDTFSFAFSTSRFELSQSPGLSEPAELYTIVEVNNRILNPGYNKDFVVDNSQIEFFLDKFQIPSTTIDPADVRVFLNKKELERNVDFIVNIKNSSVILNAGIAKSMDNVEVYVSTDSEYSIDGNTLTLANLTNPGDEVSVYQFTNHDILDIDRQIYDVVARSTLTPGTEEYTKYHYLTGGKIELTSAASAVQYVWVIQNGIMLSPTVDYTLSSDRRFVYLKNDPALNDTIDIIHFAAPRSTPRIAFRQFKDILNRTHYKRVDNATDAVLAKSLRSNDLRIEVADASSLPVPSKERNRPGVIFINGERIEYFIKDGNLLRQLRRGTLGTSIGSEYVEGTAIENGAVSKNIPYKDENEVQVIEVNEGPLDDLFFSATSSRHKVETNIFSHIELLDFLNLESYNNLEFKVNGENINGFLITENRIQFTNGYIIPEDENTIITITSTGINGENPISFSSNISDRFKILTTIDTKLELFYINELMYHRNLKLFINGNEKTDYKLNQNRFEFTNGYIIPLDAEIKVTSDGLDKFVLNFDPTRLADEYQRETGRTVAPENFFEIFVAGRRLRKNDIDQYQFEERDADGNVVTGTISQDSPEGDVVKMKEFSVSENTITLLNIPSVDSRITIIRKLGRRWSPPGVALKDSDTEIARFLRNSISELPE